MAFRMFCKPFKIVWSLAIAVFKEPLVFHNGNFKRKRSSKDRESLPGMS